MELEISIETLATGSHQVVRVPVTGNVTLGRGPDSPVLLEGPQISREHLTVAATGERLALWNMSPNGTLVNGGAVATGVWVSLAAGDRVQVPGYNLLFVLLGGEVARPSWIATVTGTEKTVAALVVMALGVAAIFWRL